MSRLAMPGDAERLTGARGVRMAAIGWRLVSLSVILAVWGAHAALA
jgi:hypothetical protein